MCDFLGDKNLGSEHVARSLFKRKSDVITLPKRIGQLVCGALNMMTQFVKRGEIHTRANRLSNTDPRGYRPPEIAPVDRAVRCADGFRSIRFQDAQLELRGRMEPFDWVSAK
ncbi:hypothetical protein BJY17_003258 [Agromyces hippuratus]|uniref:Uncharacterized protein n=1 Tax=Agromyces hippuratus TaxID=286438 RepID=A0A852X9A8_9MICO|nr:hypothetical protein [Agromyces hippuratus]NYG22511.1 hypothetical protein [Agromyces hippuratus]